MLAVAFGLDEMLPSFTAFAVLCICTETQPTTVNQIMTVLKTADEQFSPVMKAVCGVIMRE
jgi:hypothetical protein